MITATVEFYDKHGLTLWSGWYSRQRTISAETALLIRDKANAALQNFGFLYKEAKTITLRFDMPGKLFPETIDLRNPHFSE